MLRVPKMQGALLVATEVGDHAAFERCKELGFTYFQGEYFAQPRTFRHRGVAHAGLGSLRRLAELTAGDVSFEDLERIIASDVGLSLKLLRYVNSRLLRAAAHRRLGARGAEPCSASAPSAAGRRSWSSPRSRTCPDELVALGLRRAHMCEILAGSALPEERETLFTIGLFSVADALLDAPMAEVLDSLPFTEEIQAALLRREGPKGELLAAVAAYERGEFPTLPHDRRRPVAGRRLPLRPGVGGRGRPRRRVARRRAAPPRAPTACAPPAVAPAARGSRRVLAPRPLVGPPARGRKRPCDLGHRVRRAPIVPRHHSGPLVHSVRA